MSDDRSTLLYFTDSREPSGVGRHLALLVAGLDRKQFRPLVVCPDTPAAAPLLDQLRSMDVPVHMLTVRDDEAYAYPELVHLLQNENVTIFHAQNGVTWEGHLGIQAAHEAGVPIILATEHLPFVLDKEYEIHRKREVNQLVHKIVAVSEGVRESFVASGTTRSGQIIAIQNGIDLQPFQNIPHYQAQAVRDELGVSPQTPLIGTIARLEGQKGHWFLLKAIKQVVQHYPNATFVLAGTGSLYYWLHDQVAVEDGVQDQIIWLGERRDVPALLAACDIVVLPSLFEGLPLSALEAMAAGRPFIGTRCCGTEEAVLHEQTGLLVPTHDGDALAAAILRMLENPEWTASLGHNAQEHVQHTFNIARMNRRYQQLYSEQLDLYYTQKALLSNTAESLQNITLSTVAATKKNVPV